MSKPCNFFFQNKNKTYLFTINKPNIMKKCKYQQCFYCFIVCLLVSYAFQVSCQYNIVTTLISAAFGGAALNSGEALIRGRRLFQCGYQKVRRVLEGGAYLRPGAYQRKYGICIQKIKFTFYKQYLFGLLFYEKPKKTRTNQST